MSKKTVEQIIMQAQQDPNFMNKLLTDTAAVLKSYELSESEIDFFQQADEKTLRGLSPACFQLANDGKDQ